MIKSIEFDVQAFEASKKKAEKVLKKFGEAPARKVMIESANAGLLDLWGHAPDSVGTRL